MVAMRREAVVTLSGEQAGALSTLLHEALGELSMEISNTDNAQYRAELAARRERLREVQAMLDS